jgi:hypothetical protein
MKLNEYWFKFKNFLKEPAGKISVGFLAFGAIATIIIVPTVTSLESIKYVLSYNRDSNSGTYGV